MNITNKNHSVKNVEVVDYVNQNDVKPLLIKNTKDIVLIVFFIYFQIDQIHSIIKQKRKQQLTIS